MALALDEIRFAKKDDKEDIVRLWHDVFGDSGEYINRFLNKYDALKYALIVSKPIKAALFMLPVKLCCKGQALDGRYIYAVMTDKNYRSQGLCSQLMQRAHEMVAENGEHFCVLVPAERTLFDFYAKFGYSDKGLKLKSERIAFDDMENTPFDVCECGFEEFVKMRDEYFSKKAYFKWDKTALSYNFDEIKLSNGKILKISSPKDEFYAVCYKRDKDILIRESSISEKEKNTAVQAVMNYFKNEENDDVLSCEIISEGTKRPYAAAKCFSMKAEQIFLDNNVFLGFAMD